LFATDPSAFGADVRLTGLHRHRHRGYGDRSFGAGDFEIVVDRLSLLRTCGWPTGCVLGCAFFGADFFAIGIFMPGMFICAEAVVGAASTAQASAASARYRATINLSAALETRRAS
jgi:hypothetical protein